jgi:arylsulfatase A-like enzyme
MARVRGLGILLGIVLLAAALVACGGDDGGDADSARDDAPRGAIVIMTDDQTLASLATMPATQRWLGEGGVTFDHAISSLPLCCPARASLLTGQYAHNHGVTDNVPPDGGIQALDPASTLPVWLQGAGVATAHLGKYLNGYGQVASPDVPPGWDHWYGLVDPTTYQYTGATAFDGEQVVDVPGYQTDALAEEGSAVLQQLAQGEDPWFLSLAFTAPHVAQPETSAVLSLGDLGGQVDVLMPPAPAFVDEVAGLALPASEGLAETDLGDKPGWVQANDEIFRAVVEQAGATQQFQQLRDRFYENYVSTLLSVDAAVDQLMQALEDAGALDDTLVIFTSDNGFHFGEHGLILRKATPYEESIRVPLLVRAPVLDAGTVVTTPVANVDVTATVLDWLDVAPGLPQDGTSLLGEVQAGQAGTRLVPLESTLRGNGGAPPYHGVRAQDYSYVEYDDGVRELYDLRTDPFQLQDVAGDPAYAGPVIQLSAFTRQLRTCAGEACVVRTSVEGGPPGG